VLLRCHFFRDWSVFLGVSVFRFRVYTCSPSATVQFPWRTVWRCAFMGERVVCVRGAYCRACDELNWSQLARASHVMRNAFVNNETLSQLDVRSTENTHISLLTKRVLKREAL